MKNYKELYKSSITSAIISVVESTAITITEELILRTGSKLAKDNNNKHVVIVYRTPITESNIIQDYLEKYSDDTHFYSSAEQIQTILSKYNVVNTVCSDSIADRFKSPVAIKPVTESIVNIAIDGDIEQFKKYTPIGFRDIDNQYLMNAIREQYEMGNITEHIVLEKDISREEFYKGSFQIGDTVEMHEGLAEVIDRGSNYLVLVDEFGNVKREWPNNIHESTTKIDWTHIQTPVGELSYKGYVTKNFKELSEDTFKLFEVAIQKNVDPYLIINTIKLTDTYITTRKESLMEKIETNLEKLTEASDAEKLKAAQIIANAVGAKFDPKYTAEQVVDAALTHLKASKLTPDGWTAFGKMLKLATKLGIKYNPNILNKATMDIILREEADSADFKTDKNGKKYPASRLKFAHDKDDVSESVVDKERTDNIAQSIMRADDFKKMVGKLQSTSKTGSTLTHPSEQESTRIKKINYAIHESEDFDEDDLDDIVNNIKDENDILDCYDDDEIHLIDSETGEPLEESLEEETLNEVLSKTERIRARMRFIKTQSKRERKIQIALKRRSSPQVINKRARKLAITKLKEKLAKRPLDKLSVSEKERLERFIEKRKALVSRLALKLVPRVRKIESDRLEHKSTKAA